MAVWLVLLAGCTTHAFSQKKATLPPDHPEVYYSYFFFIEGFGDWLDAQAGQGPAKKSQVMASAARYLKIDVNELPRLIATCRLVTAKLRQLDGDSRRESAAATANGQGHDPWAAQARAAKRQAAIENGVAQLQQALSATSWSAVYGHINGAHRASIASGN